MPEYWERYGFQRDPFGFQFAEVEDWTWEVANQTFVEHRGLDEILDYSKSSVLLAKPGSGKTALCRYFAGSLRNPYSQISNKPNKPLVVNIVDFTHPALLADRPNMSLDNILATLFDYITEALVDEGKTIDTRLESQVIEHKTPLRKLLAAQTKVAELGFDRIYILVDNLDDLSIDIQEQFARILWMKNSLFTQKSIVWKFFVTDQLLPILMKSSAYKTGRLESTTILWDVVSLSELFNLRIRWASEGLVNNAAQLFEPAFLDELLLKGEKTPFDQLIQMALEHPRYGPPRALLKLSENLLKSSEGSKGKEQIHSRDWHEFLRTSQLEMELASSSLSSIDDREWDSRLSKEFHGCLLKAYNKNSMARLLKFAFDKDFDSVVKPDDFETMLFDLIELAQREGWILELVQQSHKSNPSNHRLAKFAKRFN